ncbi:MAG: esterase-like activity of phytase family protein [Pseudomonadota bacterium]
MKPALAALLLWPALILLTGCGERREAPELIAEPVVLDPADPDRSEVGELVYRGGLVLSSDEERFGGISAIEISRDGSHILALSDRGAWFTFSLSHDQDARLAGAHGLRIHDLLDADGRALSGPDADAEGLAPLGGGRYAVSFERNHRIEVYDLGEDWAQLDSAYAEPFPTPPGAERLRDNAGLEALVPLDDGALLAGIELPIIDGRPHTFWRLEDGEATAQAVRLEPGFGLTALARVPEDAPQRPGALLAVERFWSRDIGNRIRVSILAEQDGSGSGELTGRPELLAELTPDMTVDNIEGLAIAVVNGEARLFLIADDNFNARQRTLLLSFALTGRAS